MQGMYIVEQAAQTDFGDIRFATPDSSSNRFWLESKVDGDNAIFWVKIPVT